MTMNPSESAVNVRAGELTDVAACKAIADDHRAELGFLTHAVFVEAVSRGRLLVAAVSDGLPAGFVRFNHRVRGSETALYDICVARTEQRRGIGRLLVEALAVICHAADRSTIVLRCPDGLPANGFYERLGFRQSGIEAGRRRRLVVWRLTIEGPAWSSSRQRP
jgi:ribosomal protein S18 acetylase RimI-like enzyme